MTTETTPPPLAPVTRAAMRLAHDAGKAVDRFAAARRRGERIPDDLQTYLRDAPYRFAWPATSNSGNLSSSRSHVFAYNLAFEAGLALPTAAYPLRQPLVVNGQTYANIHDVLTPQQLAAPFQPGLRAGPPRDPRHVRTYFRSVDITRARAGDWTLYQAPSGSWTHVDIVERAELPGGVRLHTIGAGNPAPSELYRGGVACNPDGTTQTRTWQRVMVLRPMFTRPGSAEGVYDPDPTVRAEDV